jgi:ATP-dependent RNA helicase DDX18/HAS1
LNDAQEGAGGRGKALLFLLPSELGFLKFLSQARVPLNEYTFPPTKIANVQSQLENLIEKNYYLNKSGRDGYRSYLLAYASHGLKEIFDVTVLDLVKVAKAYGFTVPPSVNLSVGLGSALTSGHKTARKRKEIGSGGSYGKQKHDKKENYSKKTKSDGQDSRQWSR